MGKRRVVVSEEPPLEVLREEVEVEPAAYKENKPILSRRMEKMKRTLPTLA